MSGNSLTTAQYNAIEAKITDKNDNAALGLVLLTQVMTTNCTVNSGGGADYTTITAAIANTNCTTITVTGGGPYYEALVITRPLMLTTGNGGISPLVVKGGVKPNVNPRPNPEVVIGLPNNQSDPQDTQNQGTIIRVLASNITISGFTLDGANPNTNSGGSPVGGLLFNGVYINAAYAIENYDATSPAGTPKYVSNVAIQNNILQNFGVASIDLDFSGQSYAASSGNSIDNNRFDNITSTNGYGEGVYLGDNIHTTITNNLFGRTRIGIQTGNFYLANPGPTTPLISNNNISASRLGIWHNLQYQSASPFTISGNTINMPAGGSGSSVGLFITTIQSGVGLTVNNNTITGGGEAGIAVWNDPTTSNIIISGGSVTGAGYGVELYDNDPKYKTGGSTTLALSGVNINNSTTAGVFVNETVGSTLTLNLAGVTISGGPTGALLNGPNTFFDPGNTAFVGQTGDYITLQSVASPNTPNNVEGRNASYDGVQGSNLTPAQYDAI